MKRSPGRKLLSFLFGLAMVLGLVPGMGLRAYAGDDEYPIRVGGTQVTDANKDNVLAGDTVNYGKVSYNSETGTLTLDGANITTGSELGIYYSGDGDLRIVLEGNNSVAGTSTSEFTYGIYSMSNRAAVTISGSGALTASGKQCGINVMGPLTIEGGKVKTNATQMAGIYSDGSIVISGGSVDATAGSAKVGILGSKGVVIEKGATVVAAGSTFAISDSSGNVKNAIAGTGWRDVAGTDGKASIEAKPDGQDLRSYQKVMFLAEKDEPAPEPAPEPDPEPAAGTVPMHRLYNPNSGEHFYTASDAERDNLVSLGWRSEGEGWTAPAESETPVYRLYNGNAGEHHFTTSEGERDMLVAAGWSYEGIGWYSDDARGVVVRREYNPNEFACNHNYTANQAEHDFLVRLGWDDEGVAWYGVAA